MDNEDLKIEDLQRMAKRYGFIDNTPAIATESDSPKIQWTVYTINGCKYCKKAKDLLANNNQTYKTTVIKDGDRESFINKMKTKTKGYQYFPMIFDGDLFIGGYTDLEKVYKKKGGGGCLIL